MNPRKPIYAMLLIGVAIILALTFTPYALISRARQAVAAYAHLDSEAPAAAVAVSTPTPLPAPAFDVVRWYTDRGDDPARHGVLVEPCSNSGGVALAEDNPDVGFNPASLVKLSTSLTALKKLGKDYRFETKVYLDGTVD